MRIEVTREELRKEISKILQFGEISTLQELRFKESELVNCITQMLLCHKVAEPERQTTMAENLDEIDRLIAEGEAEPEQET